MSARGFVFDLDGTIVDNMAIHAQAFVRFAGRHGLPPLDEGLRARIDGKRNSDIFPDLFGRPLDRDTLRGYADEKEGLYRELSRGRLAPLPGFLRLLDLLEERGVGVAIATSAPEENVEHTLREVGLERRLTCVVRSDEVARGKPFPDVFLAAAERLLATAADCVAFEDAPAGVRAARAAGMTVVGVTTSFSAEAFASHGAPLDHAVRDYEEFLAGPYLRICSKN